MRAVLALLAALAASHQRAAAQPAVPPTVVVSADGDVRTVAEGVRRAPAGGRVIVRRGLYREPTIVVEKPLELVGEGRPVLDGEGKRQIMTITGPRVSVRGFHFRNVGTSHVEDRAAIKAVGATDCAIEDNEIEEGFFGIYLAQSQRCRVAGNVLRARQGTEAASGNGIHLWSSREVTLERNTISGHRDGIYLEFSRQVDARENVSERNLRYGMHFMYSDSCRYARNTFRHNSAGVAVMYTKHVAMTDNRFEDNWGSASYGLLLKEIYDPTVVGNVFRRNTVGLMADGATRIVAERNDFSDNGWAVKLLSSTEDGRFAGNDFVGNTFDVATNSRQSRNAFDGNFFDSYEGYDLDRDGRGDVPHRPVRLFSLLVEQNEPSLIMLRSAFVGLLDTAERVVPALTPETLVDARPAMRRLRGAR